MVWWFTPDLKKRFQQIKDHVDKNGKLSKFEVAYSDIHFDYPDSKCANCKFYQGNGSCFAVKGQINQNGLCHAITTDPPTTAERVYSLIPPNATTVLYLAIAGILGYAIFRVLDKKK